MAEVVSIKFARRGKTYYFDPAGIQVNKGDRVVVETAKGLDIGDCVVGPHNVDDKLVIRPLRPVVRVATEADKRVEAEHRELEKRAFGICKEKIASHGLEMKLVDVECSFEGNKILFFFTSDGRVDFRELVKDLASVFRTRIELRQIGVRDETKMIGGLGICGRPYCCSQFLNEFEPVSTKMAKTQSMSLNPSKISGSCGRLMCCLRYEQEAYEELVKKVPKVGAFVQTVAGYGNVTQMDILRQKVKVRMDVEGEPEVKTFEANQVAVVPGGRPKPGEDLPQVLEYIEPEPEPQPVEDDDPWLAPELFADTEDSGECQARKAEENKTHRPHGKGSGRQGGKSGRKQGQSRQRQHQKQASPPPPEVTRPASRNNNRRRRPKGKDMEQQ